MERGIDSEDVGGVFLEPRYCVVFISRIPMVR